MGYPIIIVKPKKGLKVPRPLSNRFIPEQGAEVPKSPYWVRRLADGDVEEIKKIESEKPKTTPSKKKKSDDDNNGGQE